MSDTKEDLSVLIADDATFAHLFSAIDAIEEKKGLGAVHFEEELWDNFDGAFVEEVLALRDDVGRAATTNVVKFFKEHGFTKEDITVFLPIAFIETMSQIVDRALNGSKKLRLTFKQDGIEGVNSLLLLRNQRMIAFSGMAEMNLSGVVSTNQWGSDAHRMVVITLEKDFSRCEFLWRLNNYLEKIEVIK